MFNQLTLTCAFVDEAIPCKHASQFQYLNEVIHKPREPFLTDADVTSGVSYYSNRIMSDGARNRAFEDSRLMAQLGGQAMFNSVQASFGSNINQRQQRQSFNPAVGVEQAIGSSNRLQFEPSSSSNADFGSDPEDSHAQSEANSIARQPASFGPPNPFNDAFERSSGGSFGPAEPNSGANEPELIINHHQHFQHGANQAEQAAPSQQQAFPASNNQQFGPTRELFANTAQLPAQPQATGGPHAFDFSISTNHQLSGPTNEPPSQQWAQFGGVPERKQPAAVPITAAPTQPTDASIEPRPASASRLAPGADQQAFPTLQPPLDSTTATISSTTSSVESIPATTTTTQRTLEPPTTFNSATTTSRAITTTAGAATATAGVRPGQLRRRQSSRAEQLPAAQRNQTSRASSRQQRQQDHQNLVFHHMHSNFQSTRLSSQRRAQPESSVVMRRHVQPSASPANMPTHAIEANPLVSSLEAGDFWRRPFGTQLLAPKFESMLTRRRV